MYAMQNGFRNKSIGKIFAVVFAFCAVLASFGIGNLTQGNSISGAVKTTFGVPTWITGAILTVAALLVLVGGIQSIGRVCSVVVPFMAVLYFLAGLVVIILNIRNVPAGLAQIFGMAFNFEAMGGGVAGTVIANAMRWGVARGVFSNEAGLGSAPIAAAAARTDHPSRQGYINMTGTFFDTIVVCSMTGLTIASSGMLGQIDAATGAPLTGANLTIAAFRSGLGTFGAWMVTIGIILFAFSTILGWEYYGEKSLEYLAGSTRLNQIYRIIFSLIVFIGATIELQMVWDISDTFNGMMAIPNLICLLLLSNVVAKECFEYQENVIDRQK